MKGKEQSDIEVGIVAVHYRQTADTVQFLRALDRSPMPEGMNRRAVVVDNSGDFPADAWDGDVSVHQVRPEENLGYINGGHCGIEGYLEEEGRHPQWWILANPDLRFCPSFFHRLLQKQWPPSTGWVCPDIREASAWPRNPFHTDRPTARWMRKRVRLFSSSWLTVPYVTAARWKRAWTTPPAVPPEPRPIYAGHGSLAVLHRRFFKQGGTLSYDGFLYGEEIHLAEQMRRLGLGVWWGPSLRASHRGGGIINRIPISQRRVWWEESYRYLYKAYF